MIEVLSKPVVDYSCFGNFDEFYLYMMGECQLKFFKIIISIMQFISKQLVAHFNILAVKGRQLTVAVYRETKKTLR